MITTDQYRKINALSTQIETAKKEFLNKPQEISCLHRLIKLKKEFNELVLMHH